MPISRLPRSVAIALALTCAALLAAAPRTYAFLGIGDSGDVFLAQLVGNSVQQLAALSDTVATLRKGYDQAKKVAGYATDAYALAASFQRFSAKRFGERLHSELDTAYPDAAFYRNDLAAGRWAEGGRLAPFVRFCMTGTLSKDPAGQIVFSKDKLCTNLRQELGTSQVLATLGDAFGTIPATEAKTPRGVQAAVIDAEVTAQIAAQTSQWNRTQRVKQQVEQMEADCTKTSDGKGPSAACEAAAQRAQMDALAEHAETNRLLAEQARLLALQLAQHNADLKREMAEAAARRADLITQGKAFRDETLRIRTGAEL